MKENTPSGLGREGVGMEKKMTVSVLVAEHGQQDPCRDG